MRATFHDTAAINRRGMAAIAVLCACLLPLIPMRDAVAGAERPEPAKTVPASPAAIPSMAELSSIIAQKVQARAAFAAKVAPQLAASGTDRGYYGRKVDDLINDLWKLRSDPAVQQEWLAKLTDAKVPLNKRINDFYRFVQRVESAAGSISYERRKKDRMTRFPRTGKDEAARLAASLEQEKQGEESFAMALFLVSQFQKHDLRWNSRHADLFWNLRGNPEALRLAAQVLSDDSLPGDRQQELLEKLRTLPAADLEKEVAKLAANKAALERYDFALRAGARHDLVGFPVDSILPGTGQALAKNLALPLAASPVTRLPRGLTLERVRDLVPPHAPKAKADATEANEESFPLLSLLKPGERLYAVLPRHAGGGIPVFAGTPLDPLAPASPILMEYTPENIQGMKQRTYSARPDWMYRTPSYFLVASCSPEELAGHLASIAVMEGARERSLYSPFEETPKAESAYRRGRGKGDPAPFPKDTQGVALRLINLYDPGLFFVLSTQADGLGIARLLGPIRAVWGMDRQEIDTPWNTLRYDPVSALTASPATLGKDRLLSLSPEALRALVAARRDQLITSWANLLATRTPVKDKEKSSKLLAEQRDGVAKEVTWLEERGFLSPMDIGMALSILYREADNTELLAKLHAIVNETKTPASRRLEEMRDAAYEHRRMKRTPQPSKQ